MPLFAYLGDFSLHMDSFFAPSTAERTASRSVNVIYNDMLPLITYDFPLMFIIDNVPSSKVTTMYLFLGYGAFDHITTSSLKSDVILNPFTADHVKVTLCHTGLTHHF